MSAREQRETVAWEVVVRFYPGASREAHEFVRDLVMPEQAKSIQLDEIVRPDGEARVQTIVRSRL